jgi:hypothetical protein
VNAGGSYLGQFNTLSVVASTVPANGDINPYGIFVVPETVGNLVKGNVLVSNFNNSANLQGTGITLVEIAPNGSMKLFASINASKLPGSCPGGVGLTTALGVLRSGWVIVGSLPTTDGSAATAQAGCLIVLNSKGQPVETFAGGGINGPWDMTLVDFGKTATLFVSNVLNGTVAASPNVVNQGTVLRLTLLIPDGKKPAIIASKVVGSGFQERTDPAALVIGPTGLVVGYDGTLYVADTLANRLAAIPFALIRNNSAGTGNTVSSNGGLVEISPSGVQVATKTVEPGGAGTLFGLVIVPFGKGVYFVDDGTNQLGLLNK